MTLADDAVASPAQAEDAGLAAAVVAGEGDLAEVSGGPDAHARPRLESEIDPPGVAVDARLAPVEHARAAEVAGVDADVDGGAEPRQLQRAGIDFRPDVSSDPADRHHPGLDLGLEGQIRVHAHL